MSKGENEKYIEIIKRKRERETDRQTERQTETLKDRDIE